MIQGINLIQVIGNAFREEENIAECYHHVQFLHTQTVVVTQSIISRFILLSKSTTLGFRMDFISFFLHVGSLHLITVLTYIPGSLCSYFTHSNVRCD